MSKIRLHKPQLVSNDSIQNLGNYRAHVSYYAPEKMDHWNSIICVRIGTAGPRRVSGIQEYNYCGVCALKHNEYFVF